MHSSSDRVLKDPLQAQAEERSGRSASDCPVAAAVVHRKMRASSTAARCREGRGSGVWSWVPCEGLREAMFIPNQMQLRDFCQTQNLIDCGNSCRAFGVARQRVVQVAGLRNRHMRRHKKATPDGTDWRIMTSKKVRTRSRYHNDRQVEYPSWKANITHTLC